MKMFLVLQTFLDYIVNILEQFGFISRGGLQGGKLGTGESCTGEARLVKEVSRSVFLLSFPGTFVSLRDKLLASTHRAFVL